MRRALIAICILISIALQCSRIQREEEKVEFARKLDSLKHVTHETGPQTLLKQVKRQLEANDIESANKSLTMLYIGYSPVEEYKEAKMLVEAKEAELEKESGR